MLEPPKAFLPPSYTIALPALWVNILWHDVEGGLIHEDAQIFIVRALPLADAEVTILQTNDRVLRLRERIYPFLR